jgi:hypothetical protein
MVRTLVLPALVEKVVEFIPSLQLEHCFKLELDDLEVLRYDIRLGWATELVDTFGCSSPELLAVFSSLEIVLQLYSLVANHYDDVTLTYAAFDVIFRPS